MKLNISGLQKSPGAREKFDFVLTDLPEGSTVKFAQPAQVSGEVVNTGHGLELNAHVQTAVSSRCDRCLDDINVPLEFDISEQHILETELEKDQDQDQNSEDEEPSLVLTYNSDWLDLTEAVKENLILNLPMRTVCEPECPGICPSCGKNLKEESCQCKTDDVDPRLAILANLKNANN